MLSEVSRRSVLGGGVALTAAGTVPPAAAEIAPFQTAVDAAVDAALTAGACPGVCVAISRDGAPSMVKGYGRANLELNAMVTPDSVFRIGSLTKQFAAACVVKLASDGRVGLDDPISIYLPAFADAPRFTLRELMTHTAGLSDDAPSVCTDDKAKARSQIALAENIARQPRLFDFDPGSAWQYSNANYIVLGAVIEQVVGVPLAQAMRTLVLDPASLMSAAAVDADQDVVPGRVSGYTPGETAGAFINAAHIEISDTGAAGAMRATAPDLTRWHDALLSGRIFDRRWVEEMLTPGRLRDGRLSGANRFSPDDASYGDVQYGLGLLLPPANPRGRSILHYGYVNGFSACLETWVDRKVTVAVLCNGDVGPALPFRAVRAAVNASLQG